MSGVCRNAPKNQQPPSPPPPSPSPPPSRARCYRRSPSPRLLERFFLSLLAVFVTTLNFKFTATALILSGSNVSFARFASADRATFALGNANGTQKLIFRYPKWAQTFENQLSFEIKTKRPDALLLYTDDGGVLGNFYVVTIVNGNIQCDFRLGDEHDTLIDRPPIITLRVDGVDVADNSWHKIVIFQVSKRLLVCFFTSKFECKQSLIFCLFVGMGKCQSASGRDDRLQASHATLVYFRQFANKFGRFHRRRTSRDGA